MSTSAKQVKKAPQATTPWGRAAIVEELVVRQQAGQQRFASHVQLLEAANGEQLVRFAYSSDGPARRGPVTLRARDVAKLLEGLATRPALAAALGLGGGA